MRELFRSDNLVAREVACEDTSRWVVTFDNYSIGHGFDREGFGEAYLRSQGISAIHIMGRREDWYQYPEMSDVLTAVREAISGASRSITYGSSMGGYAALRFADALNVDAALALSPQYSINPAVVPFEKRWLQDAERIVWLPEGEPSLPARARAIAVYDPASIDKVHVDLIASETDLVKIPVRYSGHPSASMLAEQQMLSPLLNDVLNGTLDPIEYRREAKARRKDSVTYLITLSESLASKRRDIALQLAELAIAIQPTHIGALQCLARALYLHGRNEEALSTYEEALDQSNRNVVIAVPYADLLSELGQHQSALTLAREITARPETSVMAHIHAWHGFIAQRAGAQAEAIKAVERAVLLHPTEKKYRKLLSNYRLNRSLIGRLRGNLMKFRPRFNR